VSSNSNSNSGTTVFNFFGNDDPPPQDKPRRHVTRAKPARAASAE
jgi:hypothetical protein